jgi:hypothetical protein
VGGLVEWFGKPITDGEKYADNQAVQNRVAHYIDHGTLESGFATENLKHLRRGLLRKRAWQRLAVIVILVAIGAAAASAFTDNRAVDAIGRGLGGLLGAVALLAFLATRRGDS